jgi:hypothetical protein
MQMISEFLSPVSKLPVTLTLSLRKETGLRVFENRVLRRIFGPKRDEVTGEWRRLHNKELYALYSPPNVIEMREEVHTGF